MDCLGVGFGYVGWICYAVLILLLFIGVFWCLLVISGLLMAFCVWVGFAIVIVLGLLLASLLVGLLIGVVGVAWFGFGFIGFDLSLLGLSFVSGCLCFDWCVCCLLWWVVVAMFVWFLFIGCLVVDFGVLDWFVGFVAFCCVAWAFVCLILADAWWLIVALLVLVWFCYLLVIGFVLELLVDFGLG